MKELSEWWGEIQGSSRPWLLLGKGPSFNLRGQYDLSPYTTVAINHVIREIKADVASVVNEDVLADCGDAIYANSRFLLTPRHPHPPASGGDRPIEEFFDRYPVLRALSEEGRLVWYNISNDPIIPGSPVVRNDPFSSCILFNLLGLMGARRVRTLGIDGGRTYGDAFTDLLNRTWLTNNMSSYDLQFKDMMRAVHRYHLDYAPLNGWNRRLRLLTRWYLFRHSIRLDPGRDRRLTRQGFSEEARRA